MGFLYDLWLPIAVCTTILFFTHYIATNLLPHHFRDRQRLPDELQFLQALRELQIPVGDYEFPHCRSSNELLSDHFQRKYALGPRGRLQICKLPDTAQQLAGIAAYFLAVSVAVGYLFQESCSFRTAGASMEAAGEARARAAAEAVTEAAAAEAAAAAPLGFLKVFQLSGTMGLLAFAGANILHAIRCQHRCRADVLDGIAYALITGLTFATFHQLGWSAN